MSDNFTVPYQQTLRSVSTEQLNSAASVYRELEINRNRIAGKSIGLSKQDRVFYDCLQDELKRRKSEKLR